MLLYECAITIMKQDTIISPRKLITYNVENYNLILYSRVINFEVDYL